MSTEPDPDKGFSIEKGLEHFRAERFGAAIVHFNHFKNMQPVTKEIAQTVVTALHMAGNITRDYYKQLDASLRDLDEARKLAIKLKDPELEAAIVADLKKTVTLIAKQSRGRNK